MKLLGGLVAVYIVYLVCLGLAATPGGADYTPPALDENATDKDRAAVLADSLTHALDYELNTVAGFIPNDLLFVPNIIDNITNYQRGIIYATRPGSDMLAKTAARFGKSDTIDKRLADATSRYFTYGENVWGFWFIYDAEGKYKAGIKGWKDWAQSVGADGKNSGVYNIKSDDVYNIIKYCANMLEYAVGILNNSEMGHMDCDNNVYYAKGIACVTANVLRGVLAVDSSVAARGGTENVDEALKRLTYVAEFNPVYVVAGGNDIGDAMIPNHVAAIARHLDVANNRINDMLASMEK